MAAVVRWLDKLIEDNADPRVADWPLMQTPIPGTTMVILYLVVVWIGPKLMKDRAPYSLKNILLVFNFLMVVLSFYTLWEFWMSGWLTGYTLGCQLVDYSTSPKAMRMANVCWVFYVSKFVEMLDTVFFILRKKNNQISFLHVFHHALMPFSWWIGVKFVPGGFGTFHAMLNSFIHFMMYIYYFLAALGPAFQKFLWWKKYMTKMQLTQFALCMIHSAQLIFIDCAYPKFFACIIWSYGLIFFVMFMDFYFKAYKKGALASKKGEQNGVDKSKVH
ncbi:elongation of very long chain fatty acids protein 7-like [Patiria miniata]|uniref:Elongation of very long chain fatty acids protein n=1 Tax=Patiria miniata TaxID=46514 RepID=A0A913ZXN9_PATMI|nr:elongation of very long chain fatty acids protein 7-like [Patiria miniata]